tara:strand:- start:188 stop:391 length:204 start_codon:yes stop_codon:yes gene_type:complete
MNTNKIKYISKHINIIDREKKVYICKILLAYNVTLYQNNNGAYCNYDDLNDVLIDIIHDYLIKIFEK